MTLLNNKITASFDNDTKSTSIKYGDTLTTLIINLLGDKGTVIIPSEVIVLDLTVKGKSAKVLGVPSPNKVSFNIPMEAYETLGTGKVTVSFMLEGILVLASVDINKSLAYNSIMDEGDIPDKEPKPAIPAKTGIRKKLADDVSSLFDESGYDI